MLTFSSSSCPTPEGAHMARPASSARPTSRTTTPTWWRSATTCGPNWRRKRVSNCTGGQSAQTQREKTHEMEHNKSFARTQDLSHSRCYVHTRATQSMGTINAWLSHYLRHHWITPWQLPCLWMWNGGFFRLAYPLIFIRRAGRNLYVYKYDSGIKLWATLLQHILVILPLSLFSVPERGITHWFIIHVSG